MGSNLKSGCQFFYCDSTESGTDIFIECVLGDPHQAKQHKFSPCTLDSRNLRRTLLDGPTIEEFKNIIEIERSNLSQKMSPRFYKFLSEVEVKKSQYSLPCIPGQI